MQAWEFEEKYNLIVIRWAFGYITEEEIVYFLEKSSKALTAESRIMIVENVSTDANTGP